jgi:YycE-like protein
VAAFSRDGIGLLEISRFREHDGYDGVLPALPGSGAHLGFTAGGGYGAPSPHRESLLVVYLGDDAAVHDVVARLDVDPVTPANPYRAAHGVTFADPDGFRLLRVERDAFTPEAGYPAEIEIDGIPLRDRVWLSLDF